jgi:hypothetical protein
MLDCQHIKNEVPTQMLSVLSVKSFKLKFIIELKV